MAFPFKLAESLKHAAIVGRYRWKFPPRTPAEKLQAEIDRQILLEPGTEPSRLNEAVGFELVYGPRTLTIDGHPFAAYAVAPPRDVEQRWAPSDFHSLGSIPLIDSDPLINSLGEGDSAEEIGGRIFRRLLDDLDKLRSFWSPDFDHHLTIAAYHWLDARFKGRLKRPTGLGLKAILFQPNVNVRLLAALRGGAVPVDKDGRIVREDDSSIKGAWGALETVLTNASAAKFSPEDARWVATEAVQNLNELLKEFSLTTGDLPITLREIADRGEEPGQVEKDLRLPPDLARQWRTFRGHFERVRKTLDCEPLFALIIMWYFRKIAGKECVERCLYEQIYKNHLDKAVLAKAERLEDQKITEVAMDEKLTETFTSLKIGDEAEADKLVRILAKSILSYVKADMTPRRNPRTKFERSDLMAWLTERFAELLPYGMAAGQAIMAELAATAAQALAVYQKLGGIYGPSITVAQLRAASPIEDSEGKRLWDEACAAVEQRAAGEVGPAFRKEFNTRLGRRLSTRFEEWLRSQLGAKAGEQKADLAARLETLAAQYLAQIQFLDAQQGAVPALGASSVFVGRRDGVGNAAKPEEPKTQTMAATVTAGSAGGENRSAGRPPKSQRNTAAQDGAPDTAAASAPVPAAAPAPAWKSAFTEMLTKGASTAAPGAAPLSSGQFQAAFETLEEVRQRIVTNLGEERKGELAPARASWRGLGAAELILCGDPALSSLGSDHTSIGVYLLLEFILHLGAGPGQDSSAYRDHLEKPEKDLDCGVREVPIWNIYQVPRAEEEAMEILAQMKTYWESIADAVMDCKAYAKDVAEMQGFLRHATAAGNRVTFYNETLIEHLNRHDRASYCFAARVLETPDTEKSVAPPGYVWISKQAFPEGSGALNGDLAHAFNRDVGQCFEANLWTARSHSYPLVIAERMVGGVHGLRTFSETELPKWSSSVLLGYIMGAPTARGDRYRIDGSEHPVEVYTGRAFSEFIAPLEIQARIATAGLLQHSDPGAQRGLRFAILEALGPGTPHETTLLSGLSVGNVHYNRENPPSDRSPIGWKRGHVVPNLVAAIRNQIPAMAL